jgi:hypothetical protein
MLRGVTFQKNEDLIYTVAEARKHPNSSKFFCSILLVHEPILGPVVLYFGWVSTSFIFLFSYQLAVLSFS